MRLVIARDSIGFVCSVVVTWGAICSALGNEQPRPQGEAVAFFEQRVKPILEANCFKCHGGGRSAKGGLRLTSRAAVLEGGDLGPAVDLASPDDSRLLEAINYRGLEMPPTGKLPPDDIAVLTRWVEMGIPWTPGDEAATPPVQEEGPPQVNAVTMSFWSFRPVERPPVPNVENADWVRSPIDAFILARLEANRLQPAPPADKVALLRRVSYDLTGLPPTPAEADVFLNDDSDEAYRSLVERLLASPHYGERWGRFWLDLVRFAETNSFERDGVKPFAWRYRDYVIRSFNDDKPYDRFVREQLAGDELDDVTADSVVATGYYRIGAWDDEPTDRLQAYYDELDDIVATTGQVFLGLTVNCARCHDHKLDPIPQADYYSLLAFFHGIRPYGITKKHEESHILRPIPGRKDEMALGVTEGGPKAPETFVLVRGNAHVKGDPVEPAFPSVLGFPQPRIEPFGGEAKSSGRRRVLAEWIASPENPLTARVMVNRVWQQFFGRGIVQSPNNFGQLGDRPSHPELLDWLAAEFVDSGWRLKQLHRLILHSNAYRMSARGDADALARDPENNLFWRMNMRRLEAEEIRDSILAVNGLLNPKMAGPGMYTLIPGAVLHGQSMPGSGWGESPLSERTRRSVYIHVKRSLITPILASFDVADTDSSCPVRFSTTQSTQALGMLNSDFIQRAAEDLAERLRRHAPDDTSEQVRFALRLALARQPEPREMRRGVSLMQSLQDEHGMEPDMALRQFCLMVFNLNEFMYLD